MEEKNPLGTNQLKPCPSKINRSGRPTNEDIIIFGPQPKSFVSRMFQKLTAEHGELTVDHLDTFNKTQNKCTKLANYDALDSSIQIILDPDVDHSKITNSNKDLKKYLCDFPNCQYACKLSSNLIKHKRIHTSEKPYLCHLCSFRSNFINSLKVHERIHTAERPYVCNYCGYRCNSSSNLKKHCKHRHSSSESILELKSNQKNVNPKT